MIGSLYVAIAESVVEPSDILVLARVHANTV